MANTSAWKTSILSHWDTEPSSQRMPVDSSPDPLCRPGPIHEPDKPFNYRGPGSSGPLFSIKNSNPVFRFTVKSWPHNIDPHIKYRVRRLKLHQYATTSSNGVKVWPTTQTPETMRCWPHLTLNHQIQWREASLHSTSRSTAYHFCYPYAVKSVHSAYYFLALDVWQPGHQTQDAKVMDGQMIESWEPMDHRRSQALIAPQAHNRLWAFLTLASTCSLQVSRESRTTPRSLTDIQWLRGTPKKFGSMKPESFLLVNMSSVLSR